MNSQKTALKEALNKAYTTLSPYADSQRWESDSNLFHLESIIKNVSKNDQIIDVGCGIGILVLALKNLGYSVRGIDRYVFEANNSYGIDDIENLKKIWKKEGLEISSGDLFTSNQNASFDVVLSVAVIEHQKDLKGFIQNLISFVKKDGKVYIATPNVSNFLNRLRMLLGRAPTSNIDPFFRAGESFNGHWREYTVFELEKVAKISNLEIIEARNTQTTKPHFNTNFKKWHVSLARLGGYIFPGTGDTNYIWMKK